MTTKYLERIVKLICKGFLQKFTINYDYKQVPDLRIQVLKKSRVWFYYFIPFYAFKQSVRNGYKYEIL